MAKPHARSTQAMLSCWRAERQPNPAHTLTEVVKATLLEDLGAGLEPQGLAELHTSVLLQELRGEAAQSAEHGPAGMDQLNLAVTGEGDGVGRQAGGVPSVVTGVLACTGVKLDAGRGGQ